MAAVKVSVIIVSYNEEKNIGPCISSVLNQNYGMDNYEVIVVDGNSEDKTVDIVKEYEKRFRNLRHVINEERTIASNRNAGIKAARGCFIAFTDADCLVPNNWLKTLVDSYANFKKAAATVAAVGGANIPLPGERGYASAIGIALNNFFGSLNSVQGKRFGSARSVRSLAALNVLYGKEKLEEIGGFDISMKNMCEDTDVNQRLIKNGYKLMYMPDSFVWHKYRPTLAKWAQNMFAYGKGRAKLIKRHGLWQNLPYLAPLFFIAVMAVSLVCAFADKRFCIPLAAYLAGLIIISIYECVRAAKPGLILKVFMVYLVTHFAFSLGEVRGIFLKERS